MADFKTKTKHREKSIKNIFVTVDVDGFAVVVLLLSCGLLDILRIPLLVLQKQEILEFIMYLIIRPITENKKIYVAYKDFSTITLEFKKYSKFKFANLLLIFQYLVHDSEIGFEIVL